MYFKLALIILEELFEEVDRKRKDNRGVLLHADAVESLQKNDEWLIWVRWRKYLQVSQLERDIALSHHVTCLLQGTTCLLLPLSSNHLTQINLQLGVFFMDLLISKDNITFNGKLGFISIYITLALASLAASASAAIARWSWTGNLTSFLLNKS